MVENAPAGINLYFHTKDAGKASIKVYKGGRMINEMEIDAEVGLNHAVWRMDQIVRERSEREISRIERQMEQWRSFGASEEMIRSRFGNIKYVTSAAPEGDYEVVFEMNGEKITKTASVLKDHWFDK